MKKVKTFYWFGGEVKKGLYVGSGEEFYQGRAKEKKGVLPRGSSFHRLLWLDGGKGCEEGNLLAEGKGSMFAWRTKEFWLKEGQGCRRRKETTLGGGKRKGGASPPQVKKKEVCAEPREKRPERGKVPDFSSLES